MNRILPALSLILLSSANLHALAPFYQGKTVRIVAGYGAGSVDDAWARLIAPHMAKNIPGNPSIILQNMPGASSMIAANYLFRIAKPDGLTCRAISIETLFVREPFITWRKNGFVRVLIQTGKSRDPRLPDMQTIYELMDDFKTPEAGRSLTTVILASGIFGRLMVAVPGIVPERVKILQTAYTKAMGDPAIVAEAKERKLEFDPVRSEELEALAREVMVKPPEIIEKMKQILGN
jgi:tripartite-type tricarboxylate transporter receptor subunit TctC